MSYTAQKIPLQSASFDVWDKKYRLSDKGGKPIDSDMHASFVRVAAALAAVEKKAQRSSSEKSFLWAMDNGAIPAGRIISNASAQDTISAPPRPSTTRCWVPFPIL
ncbi:MAG: ribonucleoside-diphosphate reductase alpha chain [Lentisphaeria bacterium]